MDSVQLSFRSKAKQLFNKNSFFIPVAIISLVLSIWFGAIGYFFGIAVVLITLWANRWEWGQVGLKAGNLAKYLSKAILYAIGIFIVFDILIQPAVETYFGPIDLSQFDGIRGNFTAYIIFILIMWVTAAFGEEFFYRGYLMKKLAKLFGGKVDSWFLAAAVTALYFGMAHLYQGWSGIITTGLIGFVFGLIFMKERNLLLPILIHGLYDMIGITLIYLDKERIFLDWMNAL